MPSRRWWVANIFRAAAVAGALAFLLWSARLGQCYRTRGPAMHYLQEHGIRIQYHESGGWLPRATMMPAWMRSVRVVEISAESCDLSRLTALSELEGLTISHAECLTDEQMQIIGQFRRLRALKLHPLYGNGIEPVFAEGGASCPFTDDGLRALEGLPLVHLQVNNTSITDEGLKHLAGLPLVILDLNFTNVTDAGLKHLAHCPLETLGLAATQVSDPGIDELARLPLVWLDLRRTRVTDRGMATLANMPLEYLRLDGTAVTSGGILELRKFSALSRIHVDLPLHEHEVLALRASGAPVYTSRLLADKDPNADSDQ